MTVGKRSQSISLLVVLLALLAATPSAFAGKKLDGRWQLSITIPESPDTEQTRTLWVTLEAFPREVLHGRLIIRDLDGNTVGGVWRQVNKKVSIAYELPCAPGGQCASLILLGKVKGGGTVIKKGSVIVMWDRPNSRNPALYDTSNGSFSAERLP